MSAEHKRPLYAFVVVALLGALVIANAARSEALRSFVHREVAAVVAGTLLDRDPEPPAPKEPTVEVGEPAEEVTADASVGAAPAPKSDPRERERAADRQRGAAHPARPATAPGHAQDSRGHKKAPGQGTGHGQAKGRGHGKGHGKGHRRP